MRWGLGASRGWGKGCFTKDADADAGWQEAWLQRWKVGKFTLLPKGNQASQGTPEGVLFSEHT